MKNSITKAIKELERCYGQFNKELFNGELDNDIRIIIQTKGRKKKVIGFHAPKRWKNGDSYITEITICAEDIARYDPMEVLIHECCHNFNFQKGIKDCCTNGYHNKKFKVVAEMAGLLVKQSERYGWNETSIGEKAAIVIDSVKPNMHLFECFRLKGAVQNTYLKKFTCSCGMIIRVARVNHFSATCNNCGGQFYQVDYKKKT